MPTAFILINSEVGAENEVLRDLKKIDGVREAHVVYGIYDIIAKLEADSLRKLRDIVSKRVRKLDKVRSTLTMIVVER